MKQQPKYLTIVITALLLQSVPDAQTDSTTTASPTDTVSQPISATPVEATILQPAAEAPVSDTILPSAAAALSIDSIKSVHDTALSASGKYSTTASLPVESHTVSEGVVIDGIVLLRTDGQPPADSDTVVVIVDSVKVPLSAEGEFSAITTRAPHYAVTVTSRRFSPVQLSIPHTEDKKNYFVTIQLDLPVDEKKVDTIIHADTSAVAWTISGTIIDSRFDTPIKDTLIQLMFDDSMLTVSRQGNFTVSTNISGKHVFHLSLPGYHTVSQPIILVEEEKQHYITIPTTILSAAIVRREMTVSADALPLHRTAKPERIIITRKELMRSTATMNDPMRAIQTLPGVTAESDLSSRPIIRGGDDLEARVFLDGVPLLQPYHFGGLRSTFNQSSLSTFTLYKSGFPADMHNAQSAIVEAHSRIPSDEKLSIEADLNYMQYCVYLGIPFFDGKAGFNMSSQGSYYDAISKAAYKIIGGSSGNEEISNLSKLITLPDYRDLSAGISFTPDPKLKIFINEVYNTDRTRFCSGDTLIDVTYNYQKPLDGEKFPKDTQFTVTERYWPGRTEYSATNVDGRWDDGNPDKGVPYRESSLDFPKGDSLIDVTYFFRAPASGQEVLSDTSVTITRNVNEMRCGPDHRYTPDPEDDPFREKTLDGKPVVGRPYYDIDTFMEYRSSYNILYGTAQYLPEDDHIINLSAAWQHRGWDLTFPDPVGDFDKTLYDVSLNQFNVHLGWIYSGRKNHILKAGGQLDFTNANYDVYIVRFLHEMIKNGSTNFADYWGPVNGDTATTLFDPTYGFWENDGMYSLMDRLLVSYKGDRFYYNAAAYMQDAWDLSDRLHLDMGIRAEYSRSDHEKWLSPRLSGRYTLNTDHELTATTGLYTQNNYDISAIALSKDLKPEKVWHAGVGLSSRLLPWLEQHVDIYGKYYRDLLSEIITPDHQMSYADILAYAEDIYNGEQFDSAEDLAEYLQNRMMEHTSYSSHYVNDGSGYSYGIDYILRYNPFDFWHGWLSASWGRSFRERRPGWRVHPFPLERPLLFSIHNYYRLPKQYEIGIRYRYASGIPYTSSTFSDFLDDGIRTGNDESSYASTMKIGNFNDRRYAAYQRLDLRFSKGFTLKGGKGHFYTEIWNTMNAPNLFGIDSQKKTFQTYQTNFPLPILFVGVDYTY